MRRMWITGCLLTGISGVHDASWKEASAGDIYMRNGSHGCINLPRDKAEEIYGIYGTEFSGNLLLLSDFESAGQLHY